MQSQEKERKFGTDNGKNSKLVRETQQGILEQSNIRMVRLRNVQIGTETNIFEIFADDKHK